VLSTAWIWGPERKRERVRENKKESPSEWFSFRFFTEVMAVERINDTISKLIDK